MSIMDIVNAAQDQGNPMAESGLPLWPPMSMAGGPAAPVEEPVAAPQEDGESTINILNRMIQDAQEYLSVETDEEDKLTMTRVLNLLQGYLAREQKESDQAMQGTASPRLLRRAYGGP